jgi:hypothetical protein
VRGRAEGEERAIAVLKLALLDAGGGGQLDGLGHEALEALAPLTTDILGTLGAIEVTLGCHLVDVALVVATDDAVDRFSAHLAPEAIGHDAGVGGQFKGVCRSRRRRAAEADRQCEHW